MKIKKYFTVIGLLSLIIVPTIGLAASCKDFITEAACLEANCIWNPVKPECAGVYITEAADVITIINRIGNWIFAILLAVSGIMMIAAGFFWVTAAGEPANVMKARTMLTNAVIGLVVALLAKGVVMAVLKVIGA